MTHILRVLLTLGALLFLFVALSIYGVYVIVGLPTWGQPWATDQRWASLGTFLGGLATLFLAITALFGARMALLQYRQQREREYNLDVARLQGEVVTALRLRYELAVGSEQEPALRERLVKAVAQHEGILRGLILSQPELAKAAREAVMVSLEEATQDLQRLTNSAEGGRP